MRTFPLEDPDDDAGASAGRIVRRASGTFDRKWAETLTSAAALREAVDVVREVVEAVLRDGSGGSAEDSGEDPGEDLGEDPGAELADWW